MKNQNDLIVSVVAGVVFLIVLSLCFFMKPQVTSIAPPEKVNDSKLMDPTGVSPVMANSLSASGGGGQGGRTGAAPLMGAAPGRLGTPGKFGPSGGPQQGGGSGGSVGVSAPSSPAAGG